MPRIVTLILLNALLFSAFFLLNTTGWPGLHWDSCLYAPTIINVSKYGTWTPGVYPWGLEGGYYPLYIHGFLSVVIFGKLFHCQDWEQLFIFLGAWNGLTAVTWATLAHSQIKSALFKSQLESIAVGILAGVVSVNLQGRPEHPVVLISALPLVMSRYFQSTLAKTLTLGFTSGIIFTCSPQSGALSALLITFYLGIDKNYDALRYTKHLFATGILGLLCAFIIATTTYCIPFHEWVITLLQTGKIAADFSGHLFTFDYQTLLGVSTMSPLWSIFVLFCWSLGLSLLVRLRRKIVILPYILLSIYLWPKLTDYGYIYTFPLCYLLLRSIIDRTLIASPSYRPALATNAVLQGFLLLYTITFIQFSAEAFIATKTNNTLSSQISAYRASFESQLEGENSLGRIGHCWFAGYSFVALTDASQRYMNAPIDFPDLSFSPTLEAFRNIHKGSCQYLIVPLHLCKDQESLTISGIKYTLVCRSGEPAYLSFCLRRRAIGYAFAVFRQSDI